MQQPGPRDPKSMWLYARTMTHAQNPQVLEHRRQTRHRVNTVVFVRPSGQPNAIRARALNLSTDGVFIETLREGVLPNTQADLVFVINLGSVIKLHRRQARAVHLTAAGTGFQLVAPSPSRAR